MELPVLPPSDSFRFRIRRRTRWSDEDNQDVVNNAVYMTLLEEARFQYFSDLGLVRDNQFSFVLMQTNIRFLHPGRGGQELEIELMTTG
ncbi:MAG: YbgC/YbaW family acyl-CoA thioester hydrolase, partial [Candidatus Paceibacteria bacterium]